MSNPPRQKVTGLVDRVRWVEAVARDPKCTDFDVRVVVGISNRVNDATGKAIVSQKWLAEFACGTERGVRKSTDRMEYRGHLLIDRRESQKVGPRSFGGAGAGKANIYEPVLPPPPEPNRGTAVPLNTGTTVPLSPGKYGNHRSSINEHIEERWFQNRGTAVPKYGNGGSSLPYISNSFPRRGSTFDRSVDAGIAAADAMFGEGTSGDQGSTIDVSPLAESWPLVKAVVIGKHGDRAKSFLDHLRLRGRENCDVVLTGTGSFYLDTINRDYRDTLVAAWRAEHDWVSSVRLILSAREAAQ